jgi:hypothetical protein
MDEVKARALLTEDHRAIVSILDERGVVYTCPYSDEEIAKLPLSDLKKLVAVERDISRTPTGR